MARSLMSKIKLNRRNDCSFLYEQQLNNCLEQINAKITKTVRHQNTMKGLFRDKMKLHIKSLQQLERDSENIQQYGSQFKQENQDCLLKGNSYLSPQQLRKYACTAFRIESDNINFNSISIAIEAVAIISFQLKNEKEKILLVILNGMKILADDTFSEETKSEYSKLLEQKNTIMSSINKQNQHQMKEIILPILFFIRYCKQNVININTDNSNESSEIAFQRKLERIETILEISISIQIGQYHKVFQYPPFEPLDRKDILIQINSNNLSNEALFFDYSKTSYEKQRELKLIRFVSSNNYVFNAFDIELIVSLLFMMNIKYRIQLAQQPLDQKIFSAHELIESFFFEAVLESVKYSKQNGHFLNSYYGQEKLEQQKILKWQEFKQEFKNKVIEQIIGSKYFKEMRGVTLDSKRNPQNFDAFITKELDDSFTVTFEEVYQELTIEKYSSLPELLMLKSAFNISRSKIIPKSEEIQLNKSSIYYQEYQLYPQSNRKLLQLIIEASFFCFFHFSCEDKNFKNFDKILLQVHNLLEEQQDVLKIQKSIDGIKSLQGISNLTENQCSQVQRVAFIFVRHMYSWISSLFDRVDTKDEQPIIVKFLAKFEEIFQLKILVPPISANNKGNYLDRYLSQNPDILLVFQNETCSIYKKVKMQTGNENIIMDNIASQTSCNNKEIQKQSQITQEQSQKEQQTPISAQSIQIQLVIPEDDLPEQLSLHSDLVYLIKNWSQVLSLFYLMNIKNVISYRNHIEEEYYQISTQRLIESPLFALILEKCSCQEAQEQPQNLEWNEQHYKQIDNIMNEIWPRIAAGQNYKADNFAYSPQESLNANITYPNRKCPRYLVEFLPLKINID